MKFIESITSHSADPRGLLLDLDTAHTVRFQAVTDSIMRVQFKKNRKPRMRRTWSVALGAESVPLAGVDRDQLVFPGAPIEGQAGPEWFEFSTAKLRVKAHRSPYWLEWFHQVKGKWEPLFVGRKTGEVALGRRDHRVWHFHSLHPESRFYGLGEKTGELNRRGRKFEMRNVDPMGYDSRTTDPLYKHFPFYIEERNGVHFGLFYDNLATSTFDFGQEIDNYHGPFHSYRAEDGELDYYVMLGPGLLEVTRAFSWLTGKTYLPPKWSLGFSATSMTYTDVENAQERLGQFLDEVEEHQIPVKSFKFGSGYTSREGKRYVFTWNDSKFPDPKAITRRFQEHNIRLGANVKPVLLCDHPQYEELARNGFFVGDSDNGAQEISRFWDDRGSHLDFSNPRTIDWWQRQADKQLLEFGFQALWNDNNEYVVWDDGARCHGFGEEMPISMIRPLMSLWMTRASHELVQEASPQERVWSISRCGSPGMQRYSQTWSGDNRTSWETLEYNTKMALGLSMSGIYNIGHDVGGFSGPAPEPELLTRWFQVGAFHPRFAVNSWKEDGTITEPWMHPEELDSIRAVMAMRMRFLPQLYSLLAESHEHFTPLLRPTFMNFPKDRRCREFEKDFMWGDNLLIAPVLEPGLTRRDVYLPKYKHGWWDFHSEQPHPGGKVVTVYAPLATLPLMVRGGSFLFLAEEGADSIDGPETVREILIFPGKKKSNYEATFYDDDGLTHDYREGGFLKVHLKAVQAKGRLDLEVTIEGQYQPEYTELHFRLPKASKAQLKLTVNGEETDRFPLAFEW